MGFSISQSTRKQSIYNFCSHMLCFISPKEENAASVLPALPQVCGCRNSEPVWHQCPQCCWLWVGLVPHSGLKSSQLFPVQLSQLHKLLSCHFLGILRVRFWAKMSNRKRKILFLKRPATDVRKNGISTFSHLSGNFIQICFLEVLNSTFTFYH